MGRCSVCQLQAFAVELTSALVRFSQSNRGQRSAFGWIMSSVPVEAKAWRAKYVCSLPFVVVLHIGYRWPQKSKSLYRIINRSYFLWINDIRFFIQLTVSNVCYTYYRLVLNILCMTWFLTCSWSAFVRCRSQQPKANGVSVPSCISSTNFNPKSSLRSKFIKNSLNFHLFSYASFKLQF